jgi:hypothetical protein
MRPLVTIWLVMTIFVTAAVCSAADLSQPDKKLHAETSFYLTIGSYTGFRIAGIEKEGSFLLSFLLPLTAGFLKEANDKKPDDEDMEANLAGISTGLLVPIILEF